MSFSPPHIRLRVWEVSAYQSDRKDPALSLSPSCRMNQSIHCRAGHMLLLQPSCGGFWPEQAVPVEHSHCHRPPWRCLPRMWHMLAADACCITVDCSRPADGCGLLPTCRNFVWHLPQPFTVHLRPSEQLNDRWPGDKQLKHSLSLSTNPIRSSTSNCLNCWHPNNVWDSPYIVQLLSCWHSELPDDCPSAWLWLGGCCRSN